MEIKIQNIIVPKGRRPLDQAKVAEIAASIKTVGLLQPIGVRKLAGASLIHDDNEKFELVFGEHRLAACSKLGVDAIEAMTVGWAGLPDQEEIGKLQEIAENLHRAELTIQQRNECLAEWVRLAEKLGVPISDAERPISKPGRKPSPAVDAAATMSGLTPKTVRRAIKTTEVSPAVKKAADKAELTSKQRLAVSRRAGEEQQLKAVAEFAPPDTRHPTDRSKYDGLQPHRQRLDQLHAVLKAFAALQRSGKPGQIAEAIKLLDVDEGTLRRLHQLAAFATAVDHIVAGKYEPGLDAAPADRAELSGRKESAS